VLQDDPMAAFFVETTSARGARSGHGFIALPVQQRSQILRATLLAEPPAFR
jgi:hypothetical protein